MIKILTEKTTKRALIIFFLLAGLGAMGIRSLYLGVDHIFPEDTAWKISLSGQFEVTKDVTTITGLKPRTKKQNKLISQSFYHPGLKIITLSQPAPGLIKARARQTGKTEFIAEYYIQHRKSPLPVLSTQPALTSELRELYLQSDDNINLTLEELNILNNDLHVVTGNKPDLTIKIFLFCKSLVKDTQPKYDELSNILKRNKATTLGRAKLMVALSRLNNISARLVTGFTLNERTSRQPYYWVELFDDEVGWQAYDPEKGYQGSVPTNYVVFGYDTPNIFAIENGKILTTKYTITEANDILDVERFKQDKNIFEIFNFRRLDVDTRQTLGLLLLLPFCVLLTAFLRHVLGLNPYGTFTAPLLALAMVYTEMTVTLIVSGLVILLALIGRSILPRTLARAPRLSLIFTFVALAMVLTISLMSYFDIEQNGTLLLLPIVILVSIVDRFYSYMDDVSAHAALIRLTVTLAIALLCIPVLESRTLADFILTYPEFHLITAALVLILSSYKGKKLTDHPYLILLGAVKSKKNSKQKLDSDGNLR